MTDEVELTIVTMAFHAPSEGVADRLMAALSRYVVLSRGADGCRNIDLCASLTTPGRYLIVEKWDSPQHQRHHFDSPEMVELARTCTELLERAPAIDLLEGISAHDLA